MSWFQTIPTILVAVLIVFLPGAILARSLGTRGMAWLALSAPLSITLISTGAIAGQILHMRWTLMVLLVVTVLSSAVVWGIRYVVSIRKSTSRESLWVMPQVGMIAALLGGLALGASIIAVRLTRIFIHPGNISQTYDNVFHLNAIRMILDTGNGSSLYAGNLEATGSKSFYPAAWHDLVALVVQTTNVPIPVGINAVNIVVAALVWTLSAMYLSTRILGVRPAALLMTGILSPAFAAFPYLLINFGVLYPNFLAIALFPALIGLAADTLRISASSKPGPVLSWVLMVSTVPGLALAHPSILLALGAFALPMLVFWLAHQGIRRFEDQLSWPWFTLSFFAVAAYVYALVQVWERVRPSKKASFWPPTQTVAQALGEAFASAPLRSPVSWVILILTIVGLYALTKEPRRWWVFGPYGMGILLFAAVSGFAKGDLRSFLTGVFYNDSYRLAAMLPVMALPLVAFGAIWIYDASVAKVPAKVKERRRATLAIATVGTVAALVIGVSAQDNTVETAQKNATRSYMMTSNARLLSTDEAALIARADSNIPEGSTIIGNPATGASLIYALANRNVILPAVSSTPSAEDNLLTQHLAELGVNPAVCAAVKSLNAFYILDFGDKQINDMHIPFPSSEELTATPGLVLVDQQGPARLYRIDACK